MFKKRLTFKILLFLILSDILETFIQFCFKKSTIPATSVSVANLAGVLAFIKTVLASPFLTVHDSFLAVNILLSQNTLPGGLSC